MENLAELLKEPDATIKVTRYELLNLCIEIDKALDDETRADSFQHDALISVRGSLSEIGRAHV